MLSIHLPSYISVHAQSYLVIMIDQSIDQSINQSINQSFNQSIHINLSSGAQNITGTYIIIMLVYRRLLTTPLPGKAAV